jgi:UPF0271 protein
MKIDINSDIGESFGRWKLGLDEELMEYISSANIACGYHAGDPMVMRYTVKLAIKHRVKIGPHVGFPDLMGFGRRSLGVTPEEYLNYCLYQGGALQAIARAEGEELHHFTWHGSAGVAMQYNNEEIARAAVSAVMQFNKRLIIPVMEGSQGALMTREAEKAGIKVIKRFPVDREIGADGRLVSRKIAGSVITDPEKCAERALKMIVERKVTTFEGKEIEFNAKSILVHGDTPGAIKLVSTLRKKLEAAKIQIVPMDQLV